MVSHVSGCTRRPTAVVGRCCIDAKGAVVTPSARRRSALGTAGCSPEGRPISAWGRGPSRHDASRPCRPRQVVGLRGLGRLALFAATGAIPPLGLDPLRRHIQPDHAFVDLGDRRWRQIQSGREQAAGYDQQRLARTHNRSQRRLVAVLDEPSSRNVGEPERASWGPVPPTDDRRARRRARPPKRSIRHPHHPSPKARSGLPRGRAVPDPGATIALQTERVLQASRSTGRPRRGPSRKTAGVPPRGLGDPPAVF